MIPVRLIAAMLILMMAAAPLPPVGAAEGGSPAAHPSPAAPLPASGGWAPLGTAPSPLNAPVRALAVAGSDLYVGGEFVNAGGVDGAAGIARWDGQQWHSLGRGVSAPVFALALHGTDVYVGGVFAHAGNVLNANGIARWDGARWHPLGSGVNNEVRALAVAGSDLYIGGRFTNAGGSAGTRSVARWDGQQWHPLGSGLNGPVFALAVAGSDLRGESHSAHCAGGRGGTSQRLAGGSVSLRLDRRTAGAFGSDSANVQHQYAAHRAGQRPACDPAQCGCAVGLSTGAAPAPAGGRRCASGAPCC